MRLEATLSNTENPTTNIIITKQENKYHFTFLSCLPSNLHQFARLHKSVLIEIQSNLYSKYNIYFHKYDELLTFVFQKISGGKKHVNVAVFLCPYTLIIN